MKLPKTTITPLLWRVIVFLCLFVATSGTVGPRIISSDILFRDGFGVYGGVGKMLIFGCIAFVLLARRSRATVTFKPWHWPLLWWIAAAFGMFVVAWICVGNLIAHERTTGNLIGAHGGLLACLVLAAIGCFGPQNLRSVWQQYKREIGSAIGLSILFYIFLTVVYALWVPLAAFVLLCVTGLLHLSGLHATVIPPNVLMFDKFGITVAQFCSGIESIALFTSLYAVVGLLDWERLHTTRYFVIFPFALLLLFGLNILRVYGLIMAGYYINPQIAFSLFHTYAGMVFFIVYSTVFWLVAYKYLVKTEGNTTL